MAGRVSRSGRRAAVARPRADGNREIERSPDDTTMRRAADGANVPETDGTHGQRRVAVVLDRLSALAVRWRGRAAPRPFPRAGAKDHDRQSAGDVPAPGDRMNDDWPALPYSEWADTCATLHLWTQIVGKIRRAPTPLVNHWWNVPLYVTSRGLTTSLMFHGARGFQIDFDFIDHRLKIRTSLGEI